MPLLQNQIRLLTLCPPKDHQDSLIHCKLEVVDLLANTPNESFYAVSYTWGAPAVYGRFKKMTSELNCPIICNGESICVTENLVSFLERVQKTPSLSDRQFWVDVLCICQEDIDERTSQIMLMGRIYSSAERVVLWMGEEDSFTSIAFAGLQRISDLVTNNALIESPAYLRGGVDHLGLHVSDKEAFLSIGKFFQRCYFNRAWTIQEVILGKEVKVLCGGKVIDWDVLVVASRFFSQTGWNTFFSALSTHFSEEPPLPSYSHVPVILNSIRRDLPRQHWTTNLLYALHRSRDFKSSDLRDKVYSLLGLVEQSVKGKALLTPVYGAREVATTYINVAIQLLQDGEDLFLLSCIEGELFQRVKNLPSWVPDWTCGKSTGLLIIGYGRYSASGNTTQRPLIDHSALKLSLRGKVIDTVTLVGEAKHEVLDGQPFTKWLEILESLPPWYLDIPQDAGGESRLDAFWRTLLRNTTGRPPKLIPTCNIELRRSFEVWIREKTKSSPPTSEWENLRTCFSKLVQSNEMGATTEEFESPNSADDTDFGIRLAWAKHLRLFRTKSGYLGLGSECVREGDSVWIIPSSRVPLILRPVRGTDPSLQRYRLVGGTYLHGTMQGEKICPYCSGRSEDKLESQWESITIE
ncbi:hypothetical protein N7478_005172 [Penicillium angulare]|uniref:uncharacterized protein n=1 Tax=Penicillium angulare TaxID=116970 RepID=UPI0025405082|nr:uncharacterized protein N7478_005172 [Penicillium angulare]KAJ5279800.1 hypothetical protein N7478_005172 [Penicillium angulare]